MKWILNKLRKNAELHEIIRRIYGETFGLYRVKTWCMRNIGLSNGKKILKLTSIAKGEKLMEAMIRSNKPFMFGKYGTVEFRNIFYNDEMDSLCLNAGFFPKDKKLLGKFREVYLDSSRYLDILSPWNYQNHFIKKLGLIKKLPNIKSLVPLGVIGGSDHLWIKALEGKRVLVINPFEATIKVQYKKMDKLKILPKLKSLEIIRAVQTIAGEKDDRFETWFDALEYMKKEIDKKDFDIAIIGAGAYGFPLAAYVKSRGKQAMHLGGCVQLLFGIIGKRWEERDGGKKYWIRPLGEDTPGNKDRVEGGCYW